MTQPVLSVSGLTTSFLREGSWHAVVRDVSFEVAPREIVAIVGESGSGKSVTSLSIMRLIPRETGRTEGRIRLAGHDMLALAPKALQSVRGNDVAMVFQEPMTSLNPVMTVGDQLAEPLVAHAGLSAAAARAEAVRLMEKVRIPGARSRIRNFPHQFSGGMRQRVMIAMALACKPKLLIADEPTTALDVTIQAEVLELIKALRQEEDMSVLFITHDMGVVAEIADRTVVMYDGEVVESGPTEDIFRRPQKPYTRALLSAVPRLGAMHGHARPMRFPVVDRETGDSDRPVEVPDTIRRQGRPLLEVKNLTARFDIRSPLLRRVRGSVHAVENVSFDLRAGETLALVGESGCGKSTTGRAIMRLVNPRAGSVKLDGEDVLDIRGRALRGLRQKVQMIFQDPFASLNPRLRIGEAIAEPLFIHGRNTGAEAKVLVAELLRRVGLSPDMASRFPHEFSGGQRQRISIARALALEPRLIIADEAVSSLDVSVKAQVINLMLDLQESLGLAYLFISHDMAVVERVSHRVAVMYLGEIVEIGPRAAIFGNPQHPYTRKLIEAVPVPDPSRQGHRRGLTGEELASPIRPPDYRPPLRDYVEISAGHLVLAG